LEGGPAAHLISHFSTAQFALRPDQCIYRKLVMLRFSQCLHSAPTVANTM
jgi:hypothetical protein